MSLLNIEYFIVLLIIKIKFFVLMLHNALPLIQDEKDILKIFDPFYTTKPPGEGTGLGLWLTYEIVNSYGGEITVTSRKNEGTTFSVKFNSTCETV